MGTPLQVLEHCNNDTIDHGNSEKTVDEPVFGELVDPRFLRHS